MHECKNAQMYECGTLRGALRAFVLLCILAFVHLCISSASAQQSDRARTEALAARAAARMQALQREADQLASQEKTLLGDLRKLEVERELRSEEFRQADTRLKHIQIDVASATTRIAQLQQQDVAERPDLRARIVEIYKLGQGRYLRMLLAATDL